MSELVKTWKVRTTAKGALLTLNGREYELGPSGHSIAFEIDRAASGINAPEKSHSMQELGNE